MSLRNLRRPMSLVACGLARDEAERFVAAVEGLGAGDDAGGGVAVGDTESAAA